MMPGTATLGLAPVGAIDSATLGTLLSSAAAVFSAIAAITALAINVSSRRFEAKRAFVEFGLKQRADVATDLLSSLVRRVQLVEELTYWFGQCTSTNFAPGPAMVRLAALRDQETPPNTEAMNRALAGANLTFSRAVVGPANRVAEFTNQFMFEAARPFDRATAQDLLVRLTNALLAEMDTARVLEYQHDLFRPSRLRAAVSAVAIWRGHTDPKIGD